MKTKNYIIAFLFGALSLSSCNDFGDLNTDPTKSTVADPVTLISTVQVRYSGDRETTWRTTFGYQMSMMQMISDGWTGAHGQVYLQDPSYFEYMWEASYVNINDLQIAINTAAQNENQVNYLAVAKILKVMIFAQLTDAYGDVPYFEASLGFSEGNIKPAYDNQEDIYADFFLELKEASELFDPSLPLEGDLIYQGDVDRWAKFANSLRLRYAMRLVNADPAKAQMEATAALTDGVMESFGDAAYVSHGSYNVSIQGATEIRGNAFSQLQHFPEQITVACETYAGYMRRQVDAGNNNLELVPEDPRLRMMFGIYGAEETNAGTNDKFKSVTPTSIEVTDEFEAAYGKLTAFPPGYYLWDNTDSVYVKGEKVPGITWTAVSVNKEGVDVKLTKYFKSLQINRELTRLDLPSMYMSFAEVELFKAEMASRGWTGANISDAASHFSNAIYASIDELEYVMESRSSTGDVADFISKLWDTSVTSSELEVINMQQYICGFYNGAEAYANWRRTGFPVLQAADHASTDANLNGSIPRKFPYPNTEMNYNRENLESHLNAGVNDWGAPVWWDGDATRGVYSN